MWSNDQELFLIMKEHLFTAVIGDIKNKIGYLNQFLSPQIKPLQANMIIAGRAMTVLEADVYDEISGSSNNPSLPDKPFGLMFEALDDLENDEVYLCTGTSPTYALWGELISTRAIKLGSAGAVVNGYTRYKRNFKIEFSNLLINVE
jgi:regulator of RNase E activity RraA